MTMTNILLITSLISLLSNSLTIVGFSVFDFIFIFIFIFIYISTPSHLFYIDDVECEVSFVRFTCRGWDAKLAGAMLCRREEYLFM